MEAQVAATQPHAGTQSQRPTGTQAYEPAAQKLTPREADADQGAEDEPSVRRAVSPAPPTRIARHSLPVPSPARAHRLPRASRPARAIPFTHSCAVPDTLFPLSPDPTTQYEQLPQPFVPIEELQNCGISMTDIKVRAETHEADDKIDRYTSRYTRPPRPHASDPRNTTENFNRLSDLFMKKLSHCSSTLPPKQKCKDGGFATVKSLLTVPKKTLIELKGLSDAKVDKMLEACAKILPTDKAGGFVTATEFMEIRKDTIHIKTGAETVDAVLGGGVCTRSITELYGEWRTGKTQLCHTLAVTTQLPIEEGGGCAKVAWIDTEGTFFFRFFSHLPIQN